MSVEIKQADEADIPALYDLYTALGKADEGYFEALFKKDCVVLISLTKPQDDEAGEGTIVGFGVLNFEPKYNLYQKLNIPEVQDLNVLSDFRGQGIATEMVFAFESLAIDQGAEQIGISVGLTKDYGPAQRLYCKLGYLPDGCGVTYDRQAITAGAPYPVDDDLCLMMVKSLVV